MLRKFAGNSFIYLVGSFLTSSISFLLLPLYTRHLEPADYGILAICTTTISALSLTLTLGLDGAIPLFYYKMEARDYRKLLRTVWLWHILIPLLVVSVLEVMGPRIASGIFPAVPWNPYLRMSIWIAYFTAAAVLPVQQFRIEQRALMCLAFTLLSFTITTSMLLYFVVLRRAGALGSLKGQLLSSALIALISHIIIAHRSWDWGRPWIDINGLFASLKLCVPFMPHMAFWWILAVSDRWILGRSVSLSDLGIYNIAYTLALPLYFLGLALVSAYGPIYYQRAAQESFQGELPRLVSVYVMIHTCFALTISLLAPEALRLMTRPAYSGAAELVPWFAASYWCFAGLYCISSAVLVHHKRTVWTMFITGPPALLSIGLNWILIPHYGIRAATSNMLLAFGLMAALAVFISRRFEKIPFPWIQLAQMIAISVITYYAGYYWLTLPSLVAAIIAKGALLAGAVVFMARIAGLRLFDLKALLRRTPKIDSLETP